MSLFNKVLASIGIGSAKVDTKLYQDKYRAGEEVSGVVEIAGGATEQAIDEIYLTLVTTYIKESNDKKYTQAGVIGNYRVVEKLIIGANETKEIPFSFVLPYETPLTVGRTKVWLNTGLDIKNAIDPTDKDFIQVSPTPLVQSVLNAVQELGFKIREVECQEAPRQLRGNVPFIQEFEYIPVSGAFRGKLDELEITFLNVTETNISILMQVDRKVRGLGSLFSEMLDMDETHIRLSFTTNDIPHIQDKLYEVIQRYS